MEGENCSVKIQDRTAVHGQKQSTQETKKNHSQTTYKFEIKTSNKIFLYNDMIIKLFLCQTLIA